MSKGADSTVLNTDVYNEIREMIMTNKFQPGQRLREVELCRQFNVSRTPVREAFRALVAEGLLTSEPNKGVVVSQRITGEEKIFCIHLMGILFTESASLAAKCCTPEQLDELLAIHEQLKQQLDAEEYDGRLVGRLDDAFHLHFSEITGNRLLVELTKNLLDKRVRGYVKNVPKERLKSSVFEHELIINAIRAGDSESARAYSLIHYRKAEDFIRDRI